MKKLLSGNEAAARGAYEAGVSVCSAYPGTPSTEIFENLPKYAPAVYSEWAPNEKVATEVAYGASIAGSRSMSAMKHVGVNVAADPIFTAAYNGVGAGLVIVSADDPSMHSSQNEQDNRHYARAARLPMVEPSDSEECRTFMHAAFDISEKFDLPVLFRMTTRVCHSKSLVGEDERVDHVAPEYKRNVKKFVSTPANAKRHRLELVDKFSALEQFTNETPLNRLELKGKKYGVVSAGVAYQYAKECFPEDASFLKVGFSNPLPMKLIRELAAHVDALYVVEELDPFMEEQILASGIPCIGKQAISPVYELNPEIVAQGVFGTEPEVRALDVKPVVRPPVLCPGCPHRGFFYTLSKNGEYIIAGDIGCYTLGCAAPLNAMDSVVCMGGGFSAAMGMSKAFKMQGKQKKIFGVLGDSTFFHSGMTGAAEIIYNKGEVIPCVLDNSITGMTGHQDNPGSGETLMGEPAPSIDIEKVLRAIGYENIFIADPQDLTAMQKAVDGALASEAPAAIITRRPCLLIKRIKHDIGSCTVTDKCRGCKLCLKVGCPAVSIKDGKADIDKTLCTGCTVCAQVCPFGAIERDR